MERGRNYLDNMIANSFVWSIVSMFFCGSGLLGLIFAIVARSKVKNLLSARVGDDKMVKASNSLSKVALILSIVLMVIVVLYFILFASIMGAALSQMNF